MKKVINITLGDSVFAIEQDAFENLQTYFKNVESNLDVDADQAEVMADIELAVGEKFTARNRNEKHAVTEDDVTSVISEMGNPSDYGESHNETASAHTGGMRKRLYRDGEEKVFGGVASGLAQYFDIDTVIVRLLFVVSAFFNGFGIFVYIVLWLVVPEAKTTTERFAMRGEKVTLTHLSERVKKKFNEIERNNEKEIQGFWNSIRKLFTSLFTLIGFLFNILKKVIRYILGFSFLIGGALGLAGLVSAYSVVLLSEKTFLPTDAQTAIEIMTSSTSGIIAIGSSFAMTAIPLIVLVLVGGSLVARKSLFTVNKSIALAVVWIISITLAATMSALQVEKVLPVIGPIEGKFSDSEFQIQFDDGILYGNENTVWFETSEEPNVSTENIATTTMEDM